MLQRDVWEIRAAYLREMDVLGAARKATRGWKVQRPIGAARDLWVGLGVSERCIGAYGGVRTRTGSAGCGEEGSEEGGTVRPDAVDRRRA